MYSSRSWFHTLIFLFEIYETQPFFLPFHNSGWNKMWNKTNPPPIQWWARAKTKTRHFCHHWNGRGGGGGISTHHLTWRRVVTDAETDRWSKTLGEWQVQSDISYYTLYWVSLSINAIQAVYHSHHVRCILGKGSCFPAWIFKYVFGFDFLWSTGLFLAILRTVKKNTGKKLEFLDSPYDQSLVFGNFHRHYNVV